MSDEKDEETTGKQAGETGDGASEEEARKVPRRYTILQRIEHNWLEIFAAALLSLATIMSAFSAYQSSLWSGKESKSYSQATTLGIEASELEDKGNQQISIDVSMLTNYLNQLWNGDPKLAQGLREKGFSPELEKAFNAWIASDISGKNTPRNPMLMPEYKNPNVEKGKKLMVLAQAKTKDAQQQNDNSNNYIMLTVLFASVLFFAGIGTKFKAKGLRIFMLAMGTVFFVVSVTILATVP
jgi:hypothetical protein